MTMEKRNKALILLPSLKCGDGTAACIMNYYNALCREWQVDFLLIQKTDKNTWIEQIKKNGGEIYTLPNHNKYSPIVTERINKVIQEGKYQVIHVNFPGHIAYRALLEAKRERIPIRIFHCHNPKNQLSVKTRLSTWIYDTLCRKQANHLFACSKSAGISRFGSQKFYILGNAIMTERFQYDKEARIRLRKELDAEDSVLVGVVARITAQKTPFFLVDCFEAFKKKEPLARLLWIGEGELTGQVKSRLEAKHLLQDCIFMGRIEEVAQWYSAMDLFLLPSVFEGLGIVFLEAQCSGLPCFGSDQVPAETECTELMHRLSLQESPAEWAAYIENKWRTKINRTDRSSELKEHGYDASAIEDNLRILYDSLLTEGAMP